MISEKVGGLFFNFQRNILYLRLKSVSYAMFIHWTCINVNEEDVHALVISGYEDFFVLL